MNPVPIPTCVPSVFFLALTFGAVAATSAQRLSGEEASQSPKVAYRELSAIRLPEVNQDLKAGRPTVDVAIYLGESAGEPHGYVARSDELRKSFEGAKRIFAKAGVQLKLTSVKRVIVPPAWLSLQANEVRGKPAPKGVNAYVGYRSAGWALSANASQAFDRIIERQAHNHRTIYLLYLKQVRMAFHDHSKEGGGKIKSISTGGLSLPAYLLETRIPRRIRGAITICRNSGITGRLLAHELGHKLINVSHEYREIGPQFEVRGEGGLMIYGKGTEIAAGKEGRWHRERLHLSPFIYHLQADGARKWNADYKETGHYYDPLYGDKVIRDGIMTLPERSKK